MVTKEAVALLLITIGVHVTPDEPTGDAVVQVVTALGCLALAIVQAGAFIRQDLCRLEESCDIFSRRRRELMTERTVQGSGDYRYRVYTTWELSIAAIKEMPNEAGRDALDLLQIFSFLHYDGISEEIFRHAWRGWRPYWSNKTYSEQLERYLPTRLLNIESKEWDHHNFRKAVLALSSYSLISLDKHNLISVHPLLHTWARDRICHTEMEKVWTITALTIIMSIPWGFQCDNLREEYRHLRSLVPHIDACFGLYEDGVFHLCQVDSELQDICLDSAPVISLLYLEHGQPTKALRLTEKCMDKRKQMFGEENALTPESLGDLAFMYSEVGREVEAMQTREKVVELSKNILGEEHPDTIASIGLLAVSYDRLGRHAEASQLLEKVAEASRRTLGDKSSVNRDIIRSLASCYDQLGRLQEALQLR